MKYIEIKNILKPYSSFKDIPLQVIKQIHRADLDLISRIIKDKEFLKEYRDFRKAHNICIYCSKIFNSNKRQTWNTHCNSQECKDKAAIKGKEADKRRKETTLNTYGCENISQLQEVKIKKEQTTLKNFGVPNPSQSEAVREKIENTNLEKLGVRHSFQSQEVKDKTRVTLQKRYNVDYPQQSPKIRETTRRNNKAKYGKEETLGLDWVQAKCKESLIKNLGVDNALKSPEIKAKMQETCVKNNGGVGFGSLKIKSKIQASNIKNRGAANPAHFKITNKSHFNPSYISQNFIINGELQEPEVKNYFNFQSIKPVLNLLDAANIQYKRQPKGTRAQRDFFYEFLQSHNTNIEYEKTIKPYRVDGFISPENLKNTTIVADFKISQNSKGLIIEYLGDYWHGKSNDNALNEKCNKTAKQLFCETQERFKHLSDVGYAIVYQWESDYAAQGLQLKNFNGLLI